MSKLYINIISIFILINLTGCLYVPFMGGGIVVPADSSKINFKAKNYSIGPVSTPQFTSLISKTINSNEVDIKTLGTVKWTSPFHRFNGIAAVTDEAIILLKWYKPDKEYKIIMRLAYNENEIRAVSIGANGLTANLEMRNFDLIFKDMGSGYDTITQLQFVNVDSTEVGAEKTISAFNFLKNKIKVYDVEDYDMSSDDFELNPDETELK